MCVEKGNEHTPREEVLTQPFTSIYISRIRYTLLVAHDIEKLEKVPLSAARIVFLFLHLENPFIQKQVGKLYKTDAMQQK